MSINIKPYLKFRLQSYIDGQDEPMVYMTCEMDLSGLPIDNEYMLKQAIYEPIMIMIRDYLRPDYVTEENDE